MAFFVLLDRGIYEKYFGGQIGIEVYSLHSDALQQFDGC